METNKRIFMLIDIMLTRCESTEEDFTINLTKNYIGMPVDIAETYDLDIIAVEGDNVFSEYKSLLISFTFGEDEILPYISLSYSDGYRNLIKVYDNEISRRYEERIKKIYKKSLGEQFDTLLRRCEDDFDITKAEVRNYKLEKIIEEL